MKDHEQSAYIVIPTILFDDKSLTLSDCCLYGLITSLTKKEGYCWASNDWLAGAIGVSKVHVSRMLKKLEESKHIRMEHAPSKTGTLRKIFLDFTGTEALQARLTQMLSGDPDNMEVKTRLTSTSDPVNLDVNQYSNKKNKEDNLLSSPASKKIERTESGSVDVKSLKTRIAEEAPPVPAAPPNDPPPYDPGETPEAYIVRMTDPGPNSMEMDRWKVKHGLTYELIREEIERFADKYLVREFPDMDESQVMQVLTGKNQSSFMRIFRSSFLPRIKSNPVTSNHQPHAKSQQPRSKEPSRRKSQRELLADLYPDVAAELYGDLASGVDGRNPEPASHAHWREA